MLARGRVEPRVERDVCARRVGTEGLHTVGVVVRSISPPVQRSESGRRVWGTAQSNASTQPGGVQMPFAFSCVLPFSMLLHS